MQVLLVEDELLLAKRLQKLLLEIEPSATVLAVTRSVAETVQWLQGNPSPDLILIDIELADGQSFDVFRKAQVTAPVIFTTAYDEYAVQAFRVNSIDYLLKPIKEAELREALQKFKAAVHSSHGQQHLQSLLEEMRRMQPTEEHRKRFLVKQGQKMLSIDVDTIAYIFSENGFSFIRTDTNQKYILDYTLDELEQDLSPREFFRANRQFLLHHKSVVGIHPWFNQKLKVEVTPPTEEPIVVSRDKAPAFRKWMGE